MQIAIYEVKRQVETENVELSKAILEADKLYRKMFEIINTDDLEGEAYDHIKQYYAEIQIPLIKALICLYHEKISANNNYILNLNEYFGDMLEIDQSVLEEQLRKVRTSINKLEELLLIKEICQDYINALYILEQGLIQKINRIDEFNYVTVGLYNDFEKLSDFVIKGIEYSGAVNYEGDGLYFGMQQDYIVWKENIYENYSSIYDSITEIKSETLIEQVKAYASQWDIKAGSAYWSEVDIVIWKVFDDEHIYAQKENFVQRYNDVIKDAADKFDIPELLLAGVAYNEYGGDPYLVDDAAYDVRRFTNDVVGIENNSNTITRDADLTSFGNVSIQVRRIADCFGMEVDNMSESQKEELIKMAKNPVSNIYIAAMHLSDLKKIDYPYIAAENMTDEQIKVTATRYNRGPDLTQEDIKENLSYGEAIYRHQESIERGLYAENRR